MYARLKIDGYLNTFICIYIIWYVSLTSSDFKDECEWDGKRKLWLLAGEEEKITVDREDPVWVDRVVGVCRNELKPIGGEYESSVEVHRDLFARWVHASVEVA